MSFAQLELMLCLHPFSQPLADAVSDRMGLRTNGETKSPLRRNKYAMGEAVRAAGVRAVKQKLCVSVEEVKMFIASLDEPLCVLKPVQSAGSDDVFLCNDEDEAITAFNRIYKTVNGLGQLNEDVLVQEYLSGTVRSRVPLYLASQIPIA